MISINPFSELAASISPEAMQAYIILMVVLVIGGTILDMIHKRSAQYFFENSKKAAKSAKRTVGGGEKVGMAVKTMANEVLTSAEFSSVKRRISHLLTMYGFILFVASTAVLIFAYPAQAQAGIWPVLWHVGALMLCIGGYWFWFSIRVDLNSEGKKWNQLCRADMFIVSLLAMCTFALIWSFLQSSGSTSSWIALALFIASATFLFSTVLWSKFAHMFFKPAAAFQKRMIKADGSRENLPEEHDLTDAEVQNRFPDIPEYMGKNPAYMGPGIKREAPNHY